MTEFFFLLCTQVVQEEAKVFCKCHGLSGSCNIKTCQRYIAEFRQIGDILHQKYDNALRVKLEKARRTEDRSEERNVLHVLKKRKKSGRRRDNGKLVSTKEQPPSDALVFSKESPDYCVRRHEFPGTVGRLCSTDSYGLDSCHGRDGLCCGRGYRAVRVEIVQRCKCKFHWCCEIRCKRCEKVEIRNMCKWTGRVASLDINRKYGMNNDYELTMRCTSAFFLYFKQL